MSCEDLKNKAGKRRNARQTNLKSQISATFLVKNLKTSSALLCCAWPFACAWRVRVTPRPHRGRAIKNVISQPETRCKAHGQNYTSISLVFLFLAQAVSVWCTAAGVQRAAQLTACSTAHSCTAAAPPSTHSPTCNILEAKQHCCSMEIKSYFFFRRQIKFQFSIFNFRVFCIIFVWTS